MCPQDPPRVPGHPQGIPGLPHNPPCDLPVTPQSSPGSPLGAPGSPGRAGSALERLGLQPSLPANGPGVRKQYKSLCFFNGPADLGPEIWRLAGCPPGSAGLPRDSPRHPWDTPVRPQDPSRAPIGTPPKTHPSMFLNPAQRRIPLGPEYSSQGSPRDPAGARTNFQKTNFPQ